MNGIAINGITKTFGEKTVLNGIDLTVKRGEIFGLLGPSGAGKTTLIKILTGQLRPDNGSSEINGVNSLELKGIRRELGIMMDNFGLYERLSCFDNLKVFAGIYRISNDEIYKTLEKVGLTGAEKTAAANLSKGMKSRRRLGRVFLTDPTVMFLDEPTSGLDPTTAVEIQDKIMREKNEGKTIFLTTHNMAEAEKLCDNIALLNKGEILEYGSPAEIRRRHNFKSTVQLHLSDGTEEEIYYDRSGDEKAAEIIAGYFREGRLESIHSSEPDLETVFMELTGKGTENE